MLPGFSQENTAYAMLAHAKFACKVPLSQLGGPNFSNIGFRELGIVVLFAFCVVCAMSAFDHHVSNVFGMSPHREMVRINAGRIITRMHDLHSLGDRDIVFKHPRDTRGQVHFSSVMNAKLALSLLRLRSQPQPAFMGQSLLDFNPKARLKLFVKHRFYVHGELNSFKGFV